MEEWRVIPDFPDYEVSSMGNVRRVGNTENLKQNIKRKGQSKNVVLYKNGLRQDKQVHRLMAICFIPNPNNYPLIDHINRNPLDNRIENLRWCSYSQNGHNTIQIQKSGFSGAYIHRNKYRSHIYHLGKKYELGVFNTAEEAHEAYVKKKKELAGEFSPF
jgi:hypothetical protein